jgi:hypothetical protein
MLLSYPDRHNADAVKWRIMDQARVTIRLRCGRSLPLLLHLTRSGLNLAPVAGEDLGSPSGYTHLPSRNRLTQPLDTSTASGREGIAKG